MHEFGTNYEIYTGFNRQNYRFKALPRGGNLLLGRISLLGGRSWWPAARALWRSKRQTEASENAWRGGAGGRGSPLGWCCARSCWLRLRGAVRRRPWGE